MTLYEILMKSPLGGSIHLYEGHSPCLSRNSRTSDSGTMWFDIHNSCGGLSMKNLVRKSFMYGRHRLVIAPAEKHVSLAQCTHCWRFSHRSNTWICPFKTVLCPLCSGPHSKANHRKMASCCKGCSTAKPPIPPTPTKEPCPHKPRCLNCGLNHGADSQTCKYWKSRFDHQWVWNHYNEAKVSPLVP